MATSASSLQRKNLDRPDEVRPFEHDSGQLAVVNLEGGGSVGLATFHPGWRWSNDIKPIAQTNSCMAAHAGYTLSGQMHVVMDDGSEVDFGPGDVMVIPPGHDAWVVGNDDCVVLDWQGFVDYAKRA